MASKFCSACGAEYVDGMTIPLEKDGMIFCPIAQKKVALVEVRPI